MTAAMSDGMLKIIQNKVLGSFAQQTKHLNFSGKLQEKIKELQENGESAMCQEKNLMGWRRVPFADPIDISGKIDEYRSNKDFQQTISPRKKSKKDQSSLESSTQQEH